MAKENSATKTTESFRLGKLFVILAEKGFADRVYIWNTWTKESFLWQIQSIKELDDDRQKDSGEKTLSFSDIKSKGMIDGTK